MQGIEGEHGGRSTGPGVRPEPRRGGVLLKLDDRTLGG